MIGIARERGVSGHPGDGADRRPAVHRMDAARRFRPALESAPAGSRLHGVTEEGIPVREIAAAVGREPNVPVTAVPQGETGAHFGRLGAFLSLDVPASSVPTRELLGRRPTGPGLLEDLASGHCFDRPTA